MSMVAVRKTVVHVETVHHDGGPPVDPPLRIAVASAVVANPYAGRYEPDLTPFMNELIPLGAELARLALEALGGEAMKPYIEAFGKASIVGDNGEIEHAAMWHAPGGGGLRKLLDARGFVPSGKCMGGVGTRIVIPLLFIHSPWARSHYGIADLSIHDAPRPNELVLASALATGGRVHSRLGGLTIEQAAKGERP